MTAMTEPAVIRLRASEVAKLVTRAERAERDNARLRALVKEAEWLSGEYCECPWCNADFRKQHDPNCVAFTPDGLVK